MLNRIFRSLRGESSEDQSVRPEPQPTQGFGRRGLDSFRRSAEAESAMPVRQPEAVPPGASAEPAQPAPPAAIPTIAPFKPLVAENPAEAVDRLLPIVLGIESRAVREFLIACAKNDDPEWTTERRERHAADMEAAILTADPLDVALDLHIRMPARRGLPNPEGELRRLNHNFDEIHRKAWRLAGSEPRFSDAQLRKAISAMGKLIASGLNRSTDIFDHYYWQTVRAAAADNWPKWKEPLVAAFSEAFTGTPFSHQNVVAVIERLLQETELKPADVPELAAIEDAGAKLDAIRAAIAAELDEPFGAALFRVLDARSTFIDANKIPELVALRALEPDERGIGFVKFLDALTSLGRHGLTRWGQLSKEGGRYRFGIQYDEMPVAFSSLFQQLVRRKIELPDADRTLARFCDILPKLFYLKDRKVLELYIETMRRYPEGATVAKIREFLGASPKVGSVMGPNGVAIEMNVDVHPFKEFRIEIEDALRSLPAREAAVGTVQTGMAQSAEPISVLQGLPPRHLPDLDFTAYGCWHKLQEHFQNVLDARLYDEPHRDLLERLAHLDAQLKAHHDQGGQQTPEELIRIVSSNGFKGANFVPGFLRSAVATGARIHNRMTVFAPFVAQYPEQSRALSRLVEMLGAKSSPTRKWLDEGHDALDGIAPELMVAMLENLAANPVPSDLDSSGDGTLRSLIFLSSRLDPRLIGPCLVKMAVRDCYAKQSGHGVSPGMKNEKVGNACVWALSEMPEGAGIPYLARVQGRVNYPKVKGFIDKRLDAAAQNAGMTRGELDEITVPTHGLDRNGVFIQAVADGSAVLRVDGSHVAIEWIAAGGKALNAPSTAMKADAEAIKAIRSLAKEVKADLSVQIDRLQRIYLEKREWPVEIWYQRYCAHPLVGPLARRLIWWLDSADGNLVAVLPSADGQSLHSATGAEVFASADAKVRLWHPIEAKVEDIEAWRDRLEELRLVQPFAQAWREVYILTDAERETGTYSNRWAAHILRQHQTMELARTNGWMVTHRLGYDVRNDEPWHRMIAAHGLVADYWVEGCGGEHAEFSPGGAFTYISTDRVQFHKVDAKAKDTARGPRRGDAVPLVEIPAIVFSEIMRQGDLFTSVASIGNDPAWLDDGAEAEHPNSWRRQANEYWRSANTTELEASAKRRRAILERTIPRLKIAEKLSLDDRYLYVQGTRHQYRIHLGAGGAFRGERHICIVPKSEPTTGKVWLPFEGDRTLSIILSKALLLAQDDKITDPVILAQL